MVKKKLSLLPSPGRLILLMVFLGAILLLALPPASAQDDCIYYFYGDGCQDCLIVEGYLQGLEEKYPELAVERFEVYFDKGNLASLDDFYASYRVPPASQELPAVFIIGTYFIGKSSIIPLLEDRILDNEFIECPSPSDIAVGIVGEGSSKSVLKMLTFSLVSRSALAQSVSPAMVAVLIIFLFVLMALPDNGQMFKKGFIFILGVFLADFLFGLGSFSFITPPSIGLVFYKVIGILAVVVSLVAIKNFFGTLKVLFDKTPEKLVVKARKAWQGFLSYPSVLAIGFLAGVFTLGLSERTFMILRDLYMREIERVAIVPLIIFYILILIILLMVIVAALYLIRKKLHDNIDQRREAMNDRQVEAWKRHTLRVISLILSVIVLLLGMVLLFAFPGPV